MRSTRVLNEAMVNSTSRSSWRVRSRKASTPSLPCSPGDVRDRAALQRLEGGRPHLVHVDARPVAEGHGLLQLLAELVAEGGIGVDRGLGRLRLVDEHAVPAREGGEGERVAHVDVARQGQRRSLGPRAARDQRRGLPQRVAHRLRDVVAVEERQEGDVLAALAQQEVEQLVLLVVHHRDLAGQRDLDGALAALPERVGVGLELVAAGVAAGERAPLEADVLVEDGGREAEGAGVDRLAEQRLDLRRLVGGGGALHRRLAHHVVAERGQGRQEAEIERRASGAPRPR